MLKVRFQRLFRRRRTPTNEFLACRLIPLKLHTFVLRLNVCRRSDDYPAHGVKLGPSFVQHTKLEMESVGWIYLLG